ncbi:MAG: hypothetical protein NC417_14210 [Candidatus Gastranaerophilales bacterium]|nr:hypothetical protein [Candidatus Gastranaerophilales bacterium]
MVADALDSKGELLFFSSRQTVLLLVCMALRFSMSAAVTELVSNATLMICSFKRSVFFCAPCIVALIFAVFKCFTLCFALLQCDSKMFYAQPKVAKKNLQVGGQQHRYLV